MKQIIGISGAGAMGSGIAQVAAMAGHTVILSDSRSEALERARELLGTVLQKLEAKNKIPDAAAVMQLIRFETGTGAFRDCGLVIEAVIENAAVKKQLFEELEQVVSPDCILATNTSSLSVTAIAAACKRPGRVMGLHFFNPAPLMALVEVIPAVQTDLSLLAEARSLMQAWGKVPVVAKDTPGFIVNRVARPFYGEAIRIYEEGIATIPAIDKAMTGAGFRMGPFTLMDYIGHDVNYVVTETVFNSFFFDPRYKPSFSQKRLLEAGWLGRKSGRGFYDYTKGEPGDTDTAAAPAELVADRIIAMLINEAAEALHLGIASAEDLELAMTRGVNYPTGLLQWCDNLGAGKVLDTLDRLYEDYHEDRYRASVLLRRAARDGFRFIAS